MDPNMLRQANRIQDNIATRLQSARDLYDTTQAMIAVNRWNEYAFNILRMDAANLKYKSRDACISLSGIYRSLDYDDSEYYKGTFFRNSKHISNDLPAIIQPYTTVDITVVFQNKGVFYAWTQDKGIKLRIDIRREDQSLYDSEYTDLDLTFPGNEPGDELLNDDYNQEKTFHISFEVDFPPGLYTFIFQITDKDNQEYLGAYQQNVAVSMQGG